MQQGWVRRRLMEAQLGREALREAELVRARSGRTWQECRSRLERLAYLLRLSRRADDTALDELGVLTCETEDELRFAARAALAQAAGRRSPRDMTTLRTG